MFCFTASSLLQFLAKGQLIEERHPNKDKHLGHVLSKHVFTVCQIFAWDWVGRWFGSMSYPARHVKINTPTADYVTIQSEKRSHKGAVELAAKVP